MDIPAAECGVAVAVEEELVQDLVPAHALLDLDPVLLGQGGQLLAVVRGQRPTRISQQLADALAGDLALRLIDGKPAVEGELEARQGTMKQKRPSQVRPASVTARAKAALSARKP